MRNSWLAWIFVLVVIITIWIAFNYQWGLKRKRGVDLNDIFPEEETMPVDVEYEFMDNESQVINADKETIGHIGKTVKAESETEQGLLSNEQGIEKTGDMIKKENHMDEVKKSIVHLKTKFTIQVASFKNKKNAQRVLLKVREKGYQAYLGVKNLGKKGEWYRIYIGNFSSKKDANKFLSNVRKDYPKAFVIAP